MFHFKGHFKNRKAMVPSDNISQKTTIKYTPKTFLLILNSRTSSLSLENTTSWTPKFLK